MESLKVGVHSGAIGNPRAAIKERRTIRDFLHLDV
jgi:hypothetical protein